MKGIFARSAVMAAAMVVFASAGRAASAERAAYDREFDNAVPAVPTRLDYDNCAAELKQALKLGGAQERQLRSVLRGHNREYSDLVSRYEEKALRLKKEREELMLIRSEIKKTLDAAPDAVSNLLEADQKNEYKKLLLEEKGQQQPIVEISTKTVSAASIKKPVRKTVVKKRRPAKTEAPEDAQPATAAAPAPDKGAAEPPQAAAPVAAPASPFAPKTLPADPQAASVTVSPTPAVPQPQGTPVP